MNENDLAPSRDPGIPPASRKPTRLQRLRYWLILAASAAVVAYLAWPLGRAGVARDEASRAGNQPQVQVLGPHRLRIVEGTALFRKLDLAVVKPETLRAPALTVTGTLVASLRPGNAGDAQWQFSTPEMLGTYTEWQKAQDDIAFTRRQLDSIRRLADSRVEAQEAKVQRLARLVEAGTDTEGDLAAARTELLQAQIEGQKDLHEAETALRMAQRAEAALGRQLQQAGIEPDLLRTPSADVDVVVAEVPEAFVSRVSLGQGCEARFLGLGDRRFPGKIRAISPVLSNERRCLRVLFTIEDPEDLLRPGLYADIGLGTDAREVLLAPAGGVIHSGSADYLIVRAGPDEWRATEVGVGELHGTRVEILRGLEAGAEVVGDGAILLKPVLQEALRAGAQAGRERT